MKIIFTSLFTFVLSYVFAQSDSSKKLSFSAYGELYYSYDFAKPINHEKSDFIYNHKRANEFNINLLLAKVNYTDKNTRANLALMAGNYTEYNLAAEPNWAKFINEANVGIKLSKRNNIWLDAGIMPSHIGFESAISADCYTLTRSILADNSPYYQTGIKLSSTNKQENLTLAFLVLNGWQKIKKPDFIQAPSFGMQINYKPNDKLVLNYSNFLGTDKPDSFKAFRSFHNFFAQYNPTKKLGIIAGFDIGSDKYNATDYGLWYSPVLIIKYALNNKANVAFRGEYYYDKNQIMVTTNTTNGFQTVAFSINVDYAISDKIQYRFEIKTYNSKDVIFKNNSASNFSFTSNLTFRL